jgi:hypothetical protein
MKLITWVGIIDPGSYCIILQYPHHNMSLGIELEIIHPHEWKCHVFDFVKNINQYI